jgi:hypothetical protein
MAPQDYYHPHTAFEHVVMTHHSIKKSIRIFGKDGCVVLVSEMQQLHDFDCIEPKSAHMISCEETLAALCLMFLKQKRCGKIKGRGCADGRPQRLYKTKEETSAPTIPKQNWSPSTM